MTKAAISVEAFLLDDHFVVCEKGHRDLALGRIARNERGYLTHDGRFADRFANIRITTARHPFAVELHLELVMAQRQDAEFVAVITVETVCLRGGYNLGRLRVGGKAEGQYAED